MTFPEWQIATKQGMKDGLDGVEQFYGTLSKKYGIDVRVPEEVLSDIGVTWILQEEPEKGRPFLEKMIEMYPSSEGGYYLLGVVEERAESFDKAATLYRKSVEINPEYPPAKEKLDRLEKEGKI
ncbi:MAG: tetratricopeptide repeat protein [Candidatus Thorarchaeota archaeon]|jgi:tetratricopeptide (TPR) repeat protein